MPSQEVVAVILLVVLAGCGSLFGSGPRDPSTEETVTPVSLSETPPSTDSDWSAAGFPGVTPDGDIDASALLASHVQTLADKSFEIPWSRTATRTNGSLDQFTDSFTYQVRVAADSRFRLVENSSRFESRRQIYGSTDSRYIRCADTGDVTFVAESTTESPPSFSRAVSVMLYDVLARSEGGEIVERDDISSRGYVKSLYMEYDLRGGGGVATVQRRYVFRAVGNTTVTEPSWARRDTATLIETGPDRPIDSTVANICSTAG